MSTNKINSSINIINSKVNKFDKMIRQYVEIINVLLGLSNREMDLLALLMCIDLKWADTKYKNILDTYSRKYIMKETLMNKANLSRYISILKEKNALIETEFGWIINRSLLPIVNENKIKINFNLKVDDK
jgi:hypothetical protein